MKILITGGATWVKVDDVRILTSIFTGKTAFFLAEYFAAKGCEVTLLCNRHCLGSAIKKVTVVSFKYYHELKKALEDTLNRNRYDLIIHSAAVSDYKVKRPREGKIASRKKEIIIRLGPLAKLTGIIRRLAKGACLVQFKLEVSRENLMQKARSSLKTNRFDFVVANALGDLGSKYKAFIIGRTNDIKEVNSKIALANYLVRQAALHRKNRP
ncbi:MAG: phosphopantothenoylcysteine decarboxylase [Candidatus Omnitrophota bacterium]